MLVSFGLVALLERKKTKLNGLQGSLTIKIPRNDSVSSTLSARMQLCRVLNIRT
jgi:hypothetical protein